MEERESEMEELLRQATEMRCDGMSWSAIGAKLNRSPATVSSWPRKFRASWQRWSKEAGRAAEAAAQAEARASLRQMLRSDNEKTVLAAATALRRPRKRPSKDLTHPPVDSDLTEFITQVRQLSDDELRRLVEQAAFTSGRDSGMASAGGPARTERLG